MTFKLTIYQKYQNIKIRVLKHCLTGLKKYQNVLIHVTFRLSLIRNTLHMHTSQKMLFLSYKTVWKAKITTDLNWAQDIFKMSSGM